MTWPLCECGCGQPVAADKRSGRPTRYAGRACSQLQSGRVARKRAQPGKRRRCTTCKVSKPWSAFDSRSAKRCKTCKHRAVSQPCEICGEPAGMGARGRSRTFCAKPECRSAWFSKTRKVAVVKQAKKLAARKTKRCPSCDRTKPLTAEFWSPNNVKFDGSLRWDSYCKTCRAAIARDRHRSDPEKRERRRASQKRRREEIKAMRAADPAFDEELRRLHREQNRRSRARRAEREAEEVRKTQLPHAGGVEIPAFPLAVFIDRHADREQRRLNGHAPDMDETLEMVCRKFGIASRRVREWRKQPGAGVRLDVVDRVITNTGLLWFDIYDEEQFPAEHQLAAMAFEGA